MEVLGREERLRPEVRVCACTGKHAFFLGVWAADGRHREMPHGISAAGVISQHHLFRKLALNSPFLPLCGNSKSIFSSNRERSESPQGLGSSHSCGRKDLPWGTLRTLKGNISASSCRHVLPTGFLGACGGDDSHPRKSTSAPHWPGTNRKDQYACPQPSIHSLKSFLYSEFICGFSSRDVKAIGDVTPT